MKKLITLSIFASFISLLILWNQGQFPKQVRTEIEIAASPEHVWATLMNFKTWHEWNPIVKKANGNPIVGQHLQVTMVGEKGKAGPEGPSYEPEVTFAKAPEELRWRAHMLASFVFTNGKIFKLETSPLGTKMIHTETFQGLLMPLMWSHMEKSVPLMLEAMNNALKSRVEGVQPK